MSSRPIAYGLISIYSRFPHRLIIYRLNCLLKLFIYVLGVLDNIVELFTQQKCARVIRQLYGWETEGEKESKGWA